MSTPPPDAREWVSFEDPDEERTWVFDVSFLTSRWTCIFGAGCLGVLTAAAPELEQGCCSYGAHFTGEEDVARVEEAASGLTAGQWQFRDRGWSRDGELAVVEADAEGATVTRQVDDACIFLNRPGFAAGAGCALHLAALEGGRRPLELKPDVCWQLPLRREDAEEESGRVVSRIVQWDRSHWGEGGREFHWWCTEATEAFVGATPVYRAMEDELVELVGRPVYDLLVAYLGSKPRTAYLAHPATRVELRPKPARSRR